MKVIGSRSPTFASAAAASVLMDDNPAKPIDSIGYPYGVGNSENEFPFFRRWRICDFKILATRKQSGRGEEE
jgi:hypothetical protein